MSLSDAFNGLLALHQRPMTLTRGDDSIEIYASPSNYSRNLAGPSETVIEGREFVISKKQMQDPFTLLKRGDRLTDSELGTFAISEIIEMYALGGEIIGWRVRTS